MKISKAALIGAIAEIYDKINMIEGEKGVVDVRFRLYYMTDEEKMHYTTESLECELCDDDKNVWHVEELTYVKEVKNWDGKDVGQRVVKSF